MGGGKYAQNRDLTAYAAASRAGHSPVSETEPRQSSISVRNGIDNAVLSLRSLKHLGLRSPRPLFYFSTLLISTVNNLTSAQCTHARGTGLPFAFGRQGLPVFTTASSLSQHPMTECEWSRQSAHLQNVSRPIRYSSR